MQKTTREEIILKSTDVFLNQGYHKTSMEDLAKACGLKKGSFYHYFKNKEELMQEVLTSVNQYFKLKVFSIAYLEELSPKERLDKMQSKAFKLFAGTRRGCIMGNSVLETIKILPVFNDVLKDFFESWVDSLVEVFKNKYSEEEAERMGWQVVQEVEGAIMMVRLYNNTDFLKDTYQRILTYL